MLIKAGVGEDCAWREEDGAWLTDCHGELVINEGTPSDNNMVYCCYCGKKIAEFPEEVQKC